MSGFVFTRIKQPIHRNYTLNLESVKRVDSLRDLGVIFPSPLSFNAHINDILSKANKMGGFIKRQYDNAFSVYLQLFDSLVRSHLEFCSVIWDPFHTTHIDS